MMNLTRLITVLFMLTAFVNTSLAEQPFNTDGGATVSDDADAASDPGVTAEVVSSDEGSAATDAGVPSGAFSPNPCWDDECSAQSAACQTDANCTAFNTCWKHQGTQQEKTACFEDLAAELGQEGYDAANVLHQALRECGWAACNDPNAGSCADAGKDGAADRCGQWDDSWACNCDDACSQFTDCCADMETVCGGTTPGSGSCAGACGSADPQGDCYCDDACGANGDCCPDYETECGGGNTCTPNCVGKQCGDDGCGNTCGSCEGSFTCNAVGQCVAPGTTPGPDADSSSTDSGGTPQSADIPGTDGSVGTDTNSGPSTGNTGGGGSGGCTANASAHTPWALVLLCAMLAVGIRRRRSFNL